MNNVNSYLNLIEHDLKTLDLLTGKRPNHLTKEDFSDWEVTILFYMACIYIKAVCNLFGEDIQDHYTLRQIINTRPELYSIARSYRHLEEASRDARYEGRKFSRSYLIDRLLPKFNAVRDCAVSLLKQHNVTNIPDIDPEPLLRRPL